MEFMIQWFWIIKLLIAVVFGISLYNLYKSGGKSKFWWVMSIIGVLFIWISPVKLETNTHTQQIQNNYQIEQAKVLPDKVEDNTFNTKTTSVEGITNKDLK